MTMRRIWPHLAVFGLLTAASATAGAAAENLVLAAARGAAGVACPQAEGVYLVLLVPQDGSILLATRPFPGGRQVGSVEGDRLRFSLPGHDSQELETASSHPVAVPIWGAADRSLPVGGRSGCLSFGDRAFTSVDDLWTYIHWLLRDVFFRLRAPEVADPLALRLADRTITLEISATGHQPIRLRAQEAGIAGLRLPDSPTVHYFQPLVLDADAGRLAVKVLVKEGAFFGEGTAREVAFVVAGREAPGVAPGEPALEIRCAGID